MDGNVKGALLRNHVEAAKAVLGAAALGRLIETLPAGPRAILENPILPSVWYSEDASVALCGALLATLGEKATEDVGFALQKATIKQVHQFVARVVGLERLMPMGARLWGFYHDTGEAQVDAHGPGRMSYTIRGCRAVLEAGYPETIRGALRAMVEATRTAVKSCEYRRASTQQLVYAIEY